MAAAKQAGKTDLKARRVPVGSCTWCAHPPHGAAACSKNIRIDLKGATRPCNCKKETP